MEIKNSNGTEFEESTKLEIRLEHLQKSYELEKSFYDTHMVDLSHSLQMILLFAVDTLFPQLNPDFVVELTTHADYQTSLAFKIVKKLKAQGHGANPAQVADAIVTKIPKNNVIKNVSVSGKGFINITVEDDFIFTEIDRIVSLGIRPPVLRTVTSTGKILFDMSSPNIAKEMHVGHLRSTILGESLARLFDFAWDRQIIKISHIGDWGTQFGMLIAHLSDNFPRFRTETPSIGNLQTFYRQAKERFGNDEEFKVRAYKAVVCLQRYDPDHYLAWKTICEASFAEYSKIYDRLKISDLINRGESFYNDMMANTVVELEKLGLVTLEEGRKLIFVTCGTSYPLTIVKSDGGFTYATSDLTAIRYRLLEEKVTSIYYVVDAGQSEHFEAIYEVARMAGWLTKEHNVIHIKFGVVQAEDKKRLKTRSGKVIRLVDLFDEGERRAIEKLIEKGRDKVLTTEQLESAYKAVAFGCIKYSDLMHNRVHDYIFSFDRMLDDRGNTAVYLLYFYVRMRSIIRQSGISKAELQNVAKNPHRSFTHVSERNVCLSILQFPSVINRALDECMLHVLCEYAYSLCTVFSDFYEKCHCIDNGENGKVINVERLLIVESASMVLGQLFDILGIDRIDYI